MSKKHPTAIPTTGFELLRLDPDYDGSCPCARFEIDGTRLETHCWRVCNRCEWVGLHYLGDRTIAERIKPLLDEMDWYGEWPIVEGLRSWDEPAEAER